jgi:hypothetical protein
MAAWRIIVPVILLTGCQPWSKPQYAPMAASPQPIVIEQQPGMAVAPVILPQGPVVAAPNAFVVPPMMQPQPIFIQPGPEMLPLVPAQPLVAPPGSAMPGPVFGPPVAPQPVAPSGPLSDIAPGGMVSPEFGLPAGPEALPQLPSAISVPVANEEWAWDQITDVVSDYFPIAAEQPARGAAEVPSEGRIDTAWQDGATWLEPHRGDSVGSFNRWESTFQTIRRRATLRVIPLGAGYTIEAIVDKELEYLPHPERATAGAAVFRNDGSLPSRRDDAVSRTRSSPIWLPLGRDPALEQRILADIRARLGGPVVAPPVVGR